MIVSRAAVLKALQQFDGQPVKAKDVSKALGLLADDRGTVRDALKDLADEGAIVALEGRRFALPSAVKGVQGIVQRKSSGVGWFIPEDKSLKDAFLAPAELRALMNGDRVLCRIERGARGPMASLVRVVSRGVNVITGTLRKAVDKSGKSAWVEVDEALLSGPVRLAPGAEGNADIAEDGDIVEVLLLEPPTTVTTAIGQLVRRLGRRGALDAEIERLIVGARVVRAFPPEVNHQAESFPANPTPKDWAGREDIRHLPICTIDGETAKDFDDAVYAERVGKNIRVLVAVADVSHYVTRGSPLDVEARRRATSIYYPGRVIPMLPEALSNGLCSLRPEVDRLCALCEFTVDPDGNVKKEHYDFAVMKSQARLTYTGVQRFLDEEDGVLQRDGSSDGIPDGVKKSLLILADAARRLRGARERRGALDFELPELVIELDEHAAPKGIRPLHRQFAHKLIEDLMIAANEAVARLFEDKSWPCIYRIHELPDDEKLERFLRLARFAAQGKLPRELARDRTNPKALMALMHEIGDHPARQAIDSLLLRSMKQARYSVDNVGHYGLGSGAYLHFTSPIRRYPDLIVHRELRARLDKRGKGKAKKGDGAEDALLADLEDMAATSSDRERAAAELERQVQALYSAWLMKDRVGEVHGAIVGGISEAGMFVRLEDLFVEGLIRIADIGEDFWAFDDQRLELVGERSKRVFRIGDKLEVEVAGVDLGRRQIAFVPAHVATNRSGGRPERDAREKRTRQARGAQREERPRDHWRQDQGRGHREYEKRPERPRGPAGPLPRIGGPEDLRALVQNRGDSGARSSRDDDGRGGVRGGASGRGKGNAPHGGGQKGGRPPGNKRTEKTSSRKNGKTNKRR